MESSKKKRAYWMSVLSHSNSEMLDSFLQPLEIAPNYQLLRPTQIGLIQLQGRMETTGHRFMVGDITVTRAALQLDDGTCGYSYVIGRNKPHAERCAFVDALLQTQATFNRVWKHVITPLAQQQKAEQDHHRQEVVASRVNFYTLVRGE
ncbi:MULTISPECIES: phosphonate C-P lyase system protein PhnG [Lonsdalea]|uniref:Phosphonate C-P lyase system protein PhnG n=2 Tax=Lonsdalea TaxID=1082702 RepID=A0ACD1JHC2_9GAMM|nr:MULTISPECIES: phosphonate C-P lyase system protein PhnG [Lonsdalea]OSN01883.1 phosphonate C-P lyase system protein PhnG [Lonsdalea populi]QPQ23989.1 phosphonate C-P lyase system protein PhnG [Lonsdalea populi]RAT16596.1 phosphonate C-P lyase system protein PhnG [Lonsdalea quercina]RAT16736.1 phosphonate C-P lyase system protein PhnG [Lonsdalea quercina]RAT22761.1 phosphonate C-P lyase system protein PhnG [Lonsdalea populi]